MEKTVCYSHIGKRPSHEDNFLINGLYLTSDEQKKMSDNCCCFVTDDAQRYIFLQSVMVWAAITLVKLPVEYV